MAKLGQIGFKKSAMLKFDTNVKHFDMKSQIMKKHKKIMLQLNTSSICMFCLNSNTFKQQNQTQGSESQAQPLYNKMQTAVLINLN